MILAQLYLLAALGLIALGYAHARLPRHTRHRRHVWITRSVLLITGVALGALAATWTQAAYGTGMLPAFLAGLGLVHVPAAIILALKSWRAAGG